MEFGLIMAAVKAALAPLAAQIYDYQPDSPNVPCLIVEPRPFEYDATFDSTHNFEVSIVGLTGTVNVDSAARTGYGWISAAGAGSIKEAIETDMTLGDVVSSATVVRMERWGSVQLQDGGTRYLAVEVVIEILTYGN